MRKITEESSNHHNLEQMSVKELLSNINTEDISVPLAVNKCIPQIEAVVEAILPKMEQGGRLFYIGAGTSGRLGIVDASECPPTFGVDHGLIIGLIAGGDDAIRKAVEFAEDDQALGWQDLKKHDINELDSVIGIAASGTTPYVIGALEQCNLHNILTCCITCNIDTPMAATANLAIEAIVGPEFVTGSTRMKAGTAQKLILNMISTSLMIKLGRVVGNKMVDMQLSNNKLVKRGTKMIMEATGLDAETAKTLLMQAGSVRKAVEKFNNEN